MEKQITDRITKWLNSTVVDDADKDTIRTLIKEHPEEAEDAFFCNLEFGTGGLRGIMGLGSNRMNKYTVGMATQGLANYLKKVYPNEPVSVAISMDSRNNSKFFAQITSAVLTANGIHVYIFDDIRPTPLLSFAVRHLSCSAGIMITASHNPKEYNGYKVFWNDGAQLIEPHDTNVTNETALIQSPDDVKFTENPTLLNIIGSEIDNIYLTRLLEVSMLQAPLQTTKELKIVYTPLHGTGFKIVPAALRKYGFQHIFEVPGQNIPDGNFPTVASPNPEEAKSLKMAIELALETDAHILLATDPDADRIGVGVKLPDGNYELLNGNQTAVLITYYLLHSMSERGLLNERQMIVKTIVTTDLLTDIADHYNILSFEVLTGFKYIADIIRKYEGSFKYICGGEESYGFLAGDFVRDKDAVMTACLVAEIAAWAISKGKYLTDILMDIYLKFGLYKEELVSVTKKGIRGMQEIASMMESYRNSVPKEIGGKEIISMLDYHTSTGLYIKSKQTFALHLPKSNVLQYFLEDGSKITIRPSGTEPKIKFYFSVKANITDSSQYNQKLLDMKHFIQIAKTRLGI